MSFLIIFSSHLLSIVLPLLMTVCSTSDLNEKHVGKKNTGCSWKKISEFNSLESSDSVQHNEGNLGDRRIQENNRTTGGRV